MGRRKIEIKPIVHASSRRATFEKRRVGLLKKAMELSILCNATISLSIFSPDGEVFIYSSEPYEKVISKFQNYTGTYKLLTNDHLSTMIPGKSGSTTCGYEIVKQAFNGQGGFGTYVNGNGVQQHALNSHQLYPNHMMPNNNHSSSDTTSSITPKIESGHEEIMQNNIQNPIIIPHNNSTQRSSTSSVGSTVHRMNHFNIRHVQHPLAMIPPPPYVFNQQQFKVQNRQSMQSNNSNTSSNGSHEFSAGTMVGKRRSYEQMIQDDVTDFGPFLPTLHDEDIDFDNNSLEPLEQLEPPNQGTINSVFSYGH